MRQILFFLLLLGIAGCYGNPTPTPYPLQQYPATWTPAPTPTNTPPGPTATLVIQHTPGTLPARDPDARILPNAPRGAIGLWVEVSGGPPQLPDEILRRAQILVSSEPAPAARRSNQFLFLQTNAAPDPAALTREINGIVLSLTSTVTADEIATLRETVRPRLVLEGAWITDTTRFNQFAPVADGMLVQNFLRAPDFPLEQFPSESAWLADVEALAKLSSASEMIVLNTFDFGAPGASSPLVQQWMNFALASHLLAANNTHTFLGVTGAAPYNMLAPELERQLGIPIGGVTKQNGVYQRRFAKGLVLVNATADKHAFFLPRQYRSRSGNIISQIEMLPHTGEILLAVE